MIEKKRIYTVASDEELRSPSYRGRLKMAVLSLDIGQRDWPTEIQDMFLKEDGKGTAYRYPPRPFEVPLVDDVWGDERYVRMFLHEQTCVSPEKDRLLDLYFRVRYPMIARHFGR